MIQLPLFFCLLLLPINIGIESVKWQQLIAPFEKQNGYQAFRSVCMGITIGFTVSPVIGDLAAKSSSLILFSKIKAAVVAFIGNTAQLLVSIIMGGFGCILLLYCQQLINEQAMIMLMFAETILSIIFISAYLNVNKLYILWKRNKYTSYFYFLRKFSRNFLATQFILSGLRYIIFASQFALLALAFQIQLPMQIIIICIAVILGIQSLLPNIILVEIGVRGAASLFVFGLFTGQHEAILLTTYSLWFLNRCIPGIVGWLFLIRYKPVFA